jgi:putative ABC transport system permease protein
VSGTATGARDRGRQPRTPEASRIPPHELLSVALQGIRTRRLRAFLSALGIAIGIGAMVAVVGVSASSQANLLALIDSLGTNLLTVTPGQTLLGSNAVLPDTAVGSILHMPSVLQAAAIYLGVTPTRMRATMQERFLPSVWDQSAGLRSA